MYIKLRALRSFFVCLLFTRYGASFYILRLNGRRNCDKIALSRKTGQYYSGDIMQKKTIALIAHDNKKAEMVSWAMKNREVLSRFNLCGTGTTAKLVAEATELDIFRYLSGPLGGDQQIGAKIAERQIDIVVFFWDPLQAQPHDPDVKALLRIAVVYDIPIATNKATADYVITSSLL